MREYVVATAEEQAAPGEPPDLDAILPHIPDWDDFAGRFLHSGGAFVVATVDDALAGCVGITPLGGERLRDEPPLGPAAVPRTRTRTAARGRIDGRSARAGLHAHAAWMCFRSARARSRLYRSMGFVEVPPSHEYAFAMVFLGRDL